MRSCRLLSNLADSKVINKQCPILRKRIPEHPIADSIQPILLDQVEFCLHAPCIFKPDHMLSTLPIIITIVWGLSHRIELYRRTDLSRLLDGCLRTQRSRERPALNKRKGPIVAV